MMLVIVGSLVAKGGELVGWAGADQGNRLTSFTAGGVAV